MTTPSAVPARPPRDLRLDVVRGWMQVSIFVSHVAGTAFAWTIHSAWGLSDSSEQFVLLSGLTLGSVFTLKAARGGVAVAWADMARRTLRLYGTHLTVFFAFAALVLAAEMWAPLPGEVERLGWSWLAERPWFAVPAALLMVYQPAFMGILPVFVWSMLLLPPFLLLAARVGAWALVPPGAAWAAVQLGLLATPAAGGGEIAFEPFAWQALFLAGAFVGRRALLGGEGVPRRRWLVAGAAVVVLAGLAARLVEHGLVPGPLVSSAAASFGKDVLAPARLLHALALAYLVAALVPREARWMRVWPAPVLAAIGRHSLKVFCAGLFLAWGASTALAQWPADGAWLDPLLVLGGAAALAVLALALDGARRPSPPLQRVGRGGVVE
jgi:hypothetical protein